MKDWFKKHYVGVSAGVIAIIALAVGMNECSDNAARDAKVARIEADVDTLAMVQSEIIDVVDDHSTKIRQNADAINALKTRMSNVEDSIDAHRADIDSLNVRVDSVNARVDSVAAKQLECPCINPAKQRPAARRQAQRPAQRPVVVVEQQPDTVWIVRPDVEAKTQVATGCGQNQNAAVSFGDNASGNTVIINNGDGRVTTNTQAPADTVATTTRRRFVSASCSSSLTVTTVVTNGYCR